MAEVERHAEQKLTGEVFIAVEIVCTNIDDGCELYTLIRSGQILPTVSFEEKQIDTPIH